MLTNCTIPAGIMGSVIGVTNENRLSVHYDWSIYGSEKNFHGYFTVHVTLRINDSENHH